MTGRDPIPVTKRADQYAELIKDALTDGDAVLVLVCRTSPPDGFGQRLIGWGASALGPSMELPGLVASAHAWVQQQMAEADKREG